MRRIWQLIVSFLSRSFIFRGRIYLCNWRYGKSCSLRQLFPPFISIWRRWWRSCFLALSATGVWKLRCHYRLRRTFEWRCSWLDWRCRYHYAFCYARQWDGCMYCPIFVLIMIIISRVPIFSWIIAISSQLRVLLSSLNLVFSQVFPSSGLQSCSQPL